MTAFQSLYTLGSLPRSSRWFSPSVTLSRFFWSRAEWLPREPGWQEGLLTCARLSAALEQATARRHICEHDPVRLRRAGRALFLRGPRRQAHTDAVSPLCHWRPGDTVCHRRVARRAAGRLDHPSRRGSVRPEADSRTLQLRRISAASSRLADPVRL